MKHAWSKSFFKTTKNNRRGGGGSHDRENSRSPRCLIYKEWGGTTSLSPREQRILYVLGVRTKEGARKAEGEHRTGSCLLEVVLRKEGSRRPQPGAGEGEPAVLLGGKKLDRMGERQAGLRIEGDEDYGQEGGVAFGKSGTKVPLRVKDRQGAIEKLKKRK